MNKRKPRRYMISVLTYYRAEWTDVSDDDKNYRIFVDKALGDLLMGCMHRKVCIPNAAKEVAVFFERSEKRCDMCDGTISAEDSKIKRFKKRRIKDDAPESGGVAGEDTPEGV